MLLDERPDYKLSLQQLSICDQEFIECEWNSQGSDEVHEVLDELQEVFEKRILKE
jgi:hypothetical protein